MNHNNTPTTSNLGPLRREFEFLPIPQPLLQHHGLNGRKGPA